MKYSINSLIILQVFPQKYVPVNLENKPDNPKFASMNLYDYTVCTTTNTNCLSLFHAFIITGILYDWRILQMLIY